MGEMVLFLSLLLSACTNPYEGDELVYSSIGKITGPDLAACACCGGYLITIEGMQYRFDSLPPGTTFRPPDSFEGYPIPVIVDWVHPDTLCPGDRILLKSVRRR